MNPAVATLLGWVVLGEHLTALQIVEMVVILAGVMLLTMGMGLPAWLRSCSGKT